jgi:Luciferase-like monooxygenase
MRVRFAVGPDRGWLSASTLLDFAAAIETAGFDGVWLSDLPVAPTLDPLLGIALLAGRTTRLRLGANVVPLGRNPFVLAKQLAQLDQVSDGRLLLAFVTGVNQLGEREALGIAGATRGDLLEQALGSPAASGRAKPRIPTPATSRPPACGSRSARSGPARGLARRPRPQGARAGRPDR